MGVEAALIALFVKLIRFQIGLPAIFLLNRNYSFPKLNKCVEPLSKSRR
jgi:hypothetical protein